MDPVIQSFSAQEYLSIFAAFIYGHIISNTFAGWTSWVQNRKAMSFSLYHILFSALLFLLIIDIWWVAYFRISEITNGFLYFVLSLLTPITMYILTTLVFPTVRTLTVSLREYHIRNERLIYAILALNFLLNLLEVPFLERRIDSSVENYFRIGAFSICTGAVIVNKQWLNRVLLIVGFATLFAHMIIMPMPMEIVNNPTLNFSFVEYLTIFNTFIYGFVASVFFRGWGQVIQSRKLSFSKEHLAWSVLAFCLLIDLWWGSWQREEFITLNIGYFILSLLTPLSCYLLAGALFPLMRTATIDLEEYFNNNRKYIFSLFGIVLLTNFLVANVMEEETISSPENIVRMAAMALAIVLIRVDRVWVHRAILLLGGSLLVAHSIFF